MLLRQDRWARSRFCEPGSTFPPNADTQFSHIFYVWYVKVADMNLRTLQPMRSGRKRIKHTLEVKAAPIMADQPILVINSGASSLKFGLYVQRDGDEQAVLDGLADGIGRDSGKLEMKDAHGHSLRSESVRFASEDEALSLAARWLAELSQLKPVAVGHRVVH